MGYLFYSDFVKRPNLNYDSIRLVDYDRTKNRQWVDFMFSFLGPCFEVFVKWLGSGGGVYVGGGDRGVVVVVVVVSVCGGEGGLVGG